MAPSIDKGLRNAYWSEINEFDVFGAGTTEYVIIKDEIGSRHIKSITADPDEVVNAVFDGAEAVVGVLAAYYGVDASRDPIGTTKVPEVSQKYLDRKLTAAKAERTLETIRSAKLGLQAALMGALNVKTEDALKTLMKSAVQTYAAQVNGLAPEDKKPEQTTDTGN